MARLIKRGELWIVNLDPGFGRELHKKRPALVISQNSLHKDTTNAIIIPASSKAPQVIGIEMVLVGKNEGLDKQSVLLPVFIRSIDQERLVKRIGKVSKTKLAQVEEALKIVLGLTEEEINENYQ